MAENPYLSLALQGRTYVLRILEPLMALAYYLGTWEARVSLRSKSGKHAKNKYGAERGWTTAPKWGLRSWAPGAPQPTALQGIDNVARSASLQSGPGI